MNRLVISMFAGLAAGCAPYTQLKIDLVDQSRRGLAGVNQSMVERNQLIEQFYQSRRYALDSAFDADARHRAKLTAGWVITARKAYAIGVDAIHRQQQASQRAHEISIGNLAEIDRALQQLQVLHSIEQRLSLPEFKP